MTKQEFWHGSYIKGLESILPNKNGYGDKVFVSSNIAVAAFFTAHPRKYSFLVDNRNQRVYIPNQSDLLANDNGGSIYRVVGDFAKASDKLIFEFEAPSATVVSEQEIDSAVSFVTRLGFLIYVDPALHNWAYRYQQDHRGQYPTNIPDQASPINS